MRERPIRITDPKLQDALAELKQRIHQHYPQTTFQVGYSEDPAGIYLRATVDVEDIDAVVDVFIDRLVELQVEEEVPIYVVPVRPFERVVQTMQQAPRSQPIGPVQL
jgi:hypothetical protein